MATESDNPPPPNPGRAGGGVEADGAPSGDGRESHRRRVVARRRVMLWLVALLAAGAVVAGATVWWLRRPVPRLITAQDVPPEVTESLSTTFADFLAAFPNHHDCIGAVGVVLVGDVPGGDASYDPTTRLIRIGIPTSPQRFPQLLIHELAHHLEATCDADELWPSVAAIQGLDEEPRTAVWFEDPSEHFADATVEMVLGDRSIHTGQIEIVPGTLDLIERWAAG